jgi:hypothetical protein
MVSCFVARNIAHQRFKKPDKTDHHHPSRRDYPVEGLEFTTADFFAESGEGAVASINVPLLSD